MSLKRNWYRLVRFAAYHFSVFALLAYGMTGARAVHAQVPSEFVVNYDEGYETGYPIGYDTGFDIGYGRGTSEGTFTGASEGYDDGWETAYWPAWETAYDSGLLEGKVAGFAEAFPSAAAEGYQWAREVHSFLLLGTNLESSLNWTLPLINRWGDPNGWGNFTGSSDLTIYAGGFVTDLAAHYYDKGYGDGYDEGKTLGDQEGFDEAYPLAYEAAYEPAFELGSEEGSFQGLIDGSEEGYDEGLANGISDGKSIGFQIGADLYVAGGSLENLDLSAFRDSYAASLGASATVPEPTSLCLMSFFGLMFVSGRRPNRQ